jgi:hypothetical protein
LVIKGIYYHNKALNHLTLGFEGPSISWDTL